MLSNTLRLNFCFLKIIHILHPRYHQKIIGHILKNKQKNMHICTHEIIQLIIIKMEMKMKNKSQRYNLRRFRSRHGHKYSKYKKYFTMMMLLCIKQHLSCIWSLIHEKLGNTEAELKKSVPFKKKACINLMGLWHQCTQSEQFLLHLGAKPLVGLYYFYTFETCNTRFFTHVAPSFIVFCRKRYADICKSRTC